METVENTRMEDNKLFNLNGPEDDGDDDFTDHFDLDGIEAVDADFEDFDADDV